MVFSSIGFIFIFFPLFLFSYYKVPETYRNIVLFVGSLVFYLFGSYGHPEYIGLFVASIVLNYFFGLLLRIKKHTWVAVLGVGMNVLCLVLCKFVLHILPIGISFYTFQAISYLCDIRAGKCKAERSFLSFAVYLSMFPQLVAGPIVQYPSICEQIQKREYHFPGFVAGLQIFIIGLGSKVLLANSMGRLWKQLSAIGYESISTPLAWMGTIGYSFQIYFDFLGYSLMAIGLGRMLGFWLPKNFDSPYLSTSMTEFWRRWHMTLGKWFREYVYIPLGGNRKGTFLTYRNLLIVWMLTGMWHGSSLNFCLWGLLLFCLIAIEKAGLKRILDRFRLLGHLYMCLVIPLSWMVFAHTDIAQMKLLFTRLFGIENPAGVIFQGDYLKYGREYGIYLLLCALFVTRIPQYIWEKLRTTYIGQILLAGIFVASVYFLYQGLDNPFLYYQF